MATTTAMVPLAISSPEMVGPTISTRRYSTLSPSASLTLPIEACCSCSVGWEAMRMRMASGAPNSWI